MTKQIGRTGRLLLPTQFLFPILAQDELLNGTQMVVLSLDTHSVNFSIDGKEWRVFFPDHSSSLLNIGESLVVPNWSGANDWNFSTFAAIRLPQNRLPQIQSQSCLIGRVREISRNQDFVNIVLSTQDGTRHLSIQQNILVSIHPPCLILITGLSPINDTGLSPLNDTGLSPINDTGINDRYLSTPALSTSSCQLFSPYLWNPQPITKSGHSTCTVVGFDNLDAVWHHSICKQPLTSLQCQFCHIEKILDDSVLMLQGNWKLVDSAGNHAILSAFWGVSEQILKRNALEFSRLSHDEKKTIIAENSLVKWHCCVGYNEEGNGYLEQVLMKT
ncbi:hypothetical protein NEOLI_003635 [Neolecta irregularis DAH-3]|uniref:Cell division control protein 24 OB domain-containing protein n=1 Tax=Neolecta irregularis (strain DAH-3) TaxID=1198029 RepID=A0A1U7LIC6_NEOID|nr:hypothetical protein NEOLI_003635 [Neolecta irregularis DAH-3]|eukprot:OLL22281.1 hypothetical protein NEOLI_003635 [Neolecta irregularis DAH-3]